MRGAPKDLGPLPPLIFEDKDLCFISKPAGHGFSHTPITELAAKMNAHARSNSWQRNKILFKLCSGASGIIVFAKNDYAVKIRKNARRKALRKSPNIKDRTYLRTEYLVLVQGKPRESNVVVRGKIHTYKHRHHQFEPTNKQPDVVMRCSLLASVPHQTLGHVSSLSVVVLKGHATEVRAALQQALGTPVLGDTQYGGPSMAWAARHMARDKDEEGKWDAGLEEVEAPDWLPPMFIASSGEGAPTLLSPVGATEDGELTVRETHLVQQQAEDTHIDLDVFQRFKASRYTHP
jgi:23S rRNA-/tRNA-specific pseudouridylate synthase